MAALGIRSRVLVKDVMTSPVVTVSEGETAEKAAELMEKDDIGCVVVTTANEKPIGIITERDLVTRIVAKDLQPSKKKAKEIMSAPLITINADKTISEAARIMSLLNVRRLGVMHRGSLAGMLTSKDVLAVTPELIEIIQEKARIEKEETAEENENNLSSAGTCDNCGAWSEDLREVEGSFLCVDCRMEQSQPEY